MKCLMNWFLVLFMLPQREVLSFRPATRVLLYRGMQTSSTIPCRIHSNLEPRLHYALYARRKDQKRETYSTPIDGNIVIYLFKATYRVLRKLIFGAVVYMFRFAKISTRLAVDWLRGSFPHQLLSMGGDRGASSDNRGRGKGIRRGKKVLKLVREAEKEEKREVVGKKIIELQKLTTQEIKDISKPYYALNDLNWNEYYQITDQADGSWEAKNKRALVAAEASEENARLEAQELAKANKEKWRLEDEKKLGERKEQLGEDDKTENAITVLTADESSKLPSDSVLSEKLHENILPLEASVTNTTFVENQPVEIDQDSTRGVDIMNFDFKAWMDEIVDKVSPTTSNFNDVHKSTLIPTDQRKDAAINENINVDVNVTDAKSLNEPEKEKLFIQKEDDNFISMESSRKPAVVEELTPGTMDKRN